MKKIGVPLLLFIISAILSISALYMALASFIIGTVIIAFALLRTRPNDFVKKINGEKGLLLRSGVVLTVTPIVTVVLTLAAMSGFFGFFR